MGCGKHNVIDMQRSCCLLFLVASDNTSPYTGQQVVDNVLCKSLLELAEEESSDVDLLGFYPNFGHDRAMV